MTLKCELNETQQSVCALVQNFVLGGVQGLILTRIA